MNPAKKRTKTVWRPIDFWEDLHMIRRFRSQAVQVLRLRRREAVHAWNLSGPRRSRDGTSRQHRIQGRIRDCSRDGTHPFILL